MKNIKYFNKPEEFLNLASKKIKQTDIVLDIGCGINPQKYIKPIVHICAEPYEEYANNLIKKIGNKNNFFVVLKQRWNEIVNTIPKDSVDSIILLDVIEHLEKEEAVNLLQKTISLAKEQVIIFTPYGFLPQEVPDGMKDAWGLDGSEWQKHKSGWTEKDFDENWDIYICNNFHFFDAITKKKFEKPYGAMFAILNINKTGKKNIFSYINKFRSTLTYKIPLYFKSNKFIYNPILKYIYRNVFLKLKK